MSSEPAAPLPALAPSTSDLTIRPPGPLPETSARFTPSAAAARAATGDTLAPSGAWAVEGACSAGACPLLGGAAVAGASPPTAIRAIT